MPQVREQMKKQFASQLFSAIFGEVLHSSGSTHSLQFSRMDAHTAAEAEVG